MQVPKLNRPMFWNRMRGRRTYAQIWLYFACTCIGVLLVSTLFLYFLSSEAILRSIGHASESQLKASAENTAFAMNWNIDYAQRSSSDTVVKGYAFNANTDGLSDYTTWNRLNDLKKGNPYIDSIYLINDYNDTVLDSNYGVSSIGDFYDQEIIRRLSTGASGGQLVLPRNRDPYPLASTQHKIITIIVPYEPSDSISAFVVNLNSDALLPLLNQSPEYKNHALFIVNNSDVIISSNREADFLRNFRDIMPSAQFPQQSGWSSDIAPSGKQLVVYSDFSIRGLDRWRLIEFIPEKDLLGNLHVFQIVILLFFLVLLIGTLAVIRVMSRKIYSPIQELVMSVTNRYARPQKELSGESELSFLSKVFTDQNRRLDDYDRLAKFEKREALLREMLESASHPTVDRIQEVFGRFGIVIPPTSLSVVVFRIDHYDSFADQYSDRDQRLLRYAMANIIAEHLAPLFPAEAVDKGSDQIVAIHYMDPEASGSDREQAFRDCQSLIRQYLSIETSITLGPYTESYLELPEAYSLVAELSNERFKLGWGAVVAASSEEMAEPDRPYVYPAEEELLLQAAIRKGDIEQIRVVLGSIWNGLMDSSYAECRLAITNLLLGIGRTVRKLTFQKTQSSRWSLSYIQELLDRLEVMEAIYEWLVAELAGTLEDLQRLHKAPKGAQMIQDIKAIVQANLANQNLSTKWISDEIGLSVNYIRNVFKTEHAQSIIDYISDLRLDKAREQLIHTDLPIDTIVASSGFTSRVSFYSLFKKKYGTTPASFRKSGAE